MIIPKDKGKKRRNERLKEKKCQFPIEEGKCCNKLFYGTARSKYCKEHRDRKYRVIIDKGKKEKRIKKQLEESGNQIVNHNYTEEQRVIFKCALVGCFNSFECVILPNQQVYPKYCECHRNAYKRKRFIEQQEGINATTKMQPEKLLELGEIGILFDNNTDCIEPTETK